MRTRFVFHERYLWHDTRNAGLWMPAGGYIQPEPHAENPETKRRIRNLMAISGLEDQLFRIQPRPATDDEIFRFHTPDYIERIRHMSDANGGDAGLTTPFGPGSFEIARLSAGGVIEAVDAVLSGSVDNAYALVRPPGHHAEADMGKGFCLLGNAVLAILHARAVRGVGKVAVVDWDVHHGNGTERAFYEDAAVLTISVHQDNCFPPDSGSIADIGSGGGKGRNINIPLPPGSGRDAYLAVFDRVITPALRAFRPELIVVPSGFDAGGTDPLGRMMLSSTTYRSLTRTLMSLADELCQGRIVMCHEGGYSSAVVPFYAHAVIEELSGVKSDVEDPFAGFIDAMGGHQLYPHQEAIITEASELTQRVAA